MQNTGIEQSHERKGRQFILMLYGIELVIDFGYIGWACGTNLSHVIATAWIRLIMETALFYFLWRKAIWAKWSLVILWLGSAVAGVILFFTAGGVTGLANVLGIVVTVVVYAMLAFILLGSKTLRNYVLKAQRPHVSTSDK